MTLADYVVQDLRLRLQNGEQPPCKLTFSALSKHYGVSLTPVRAAVEQLVADNFLVKLSNGRLQVSDDIPESSGEAPERIPAPPTDREEVVRSDIIRQSLLGDSSYIREEAAASKYGIGRTVLRPILSRLAGQGLIEHVPRCGWRVRAFDNEDLGDFIEVREALEVKALEQARPKLQKHTLEELLEGNRSGQSMPLGSLNNNLHSYWIRESGNRYIIDFFQQHAVYFSTLFDFAAPEASVVEEMASQHCEILEPLIEDRWSDARKALVRHIRAQKPVVQQLMARIKESGAYALRERQGA